MSRFGDFNHPSKADALGHRLFLFAKVEADPGLQSGHSFSNCMGMDLVDCVADWLS